MSESQIELLLKALKLYAKAIELTNENDSTNENEFFKMVEALSEKIGTELVYY